jgi:hypothetical protein
MSANATAMNMVSPLPRHLTLEVVMMSTLAPKKAPAKTLRDRLKPSISPG